MSQKERQEILQEINYNGMYITLLFTCMLIFLNFEEEEEEQEQEQEEEEEEGKEVIDNTDQFKVLKGKMI